MQANYEITADDYLAFNLSFLKNDKRLRGRLRRSQIMGTILILAAGGVYYGLAQHPSGAALGAFVFAAFVYALFIPFSVRNSVQKHVLTVLKKGSGTACGEKTLTLEEDQVRLTGEGEDSAYDYTAIDHIVTDKAHYFLFLGPMEALIVPFRAFADADEREAFVTALQSKMDAAKAAA